MLWISRPASHNDLEAIVTLHNAAAVESHGESITAGHWQRRHWLESGLTLTTDSLVVEEAGGRLVGYGEVTGEFSYILHTFNGAVHPDFQGQGIGQTLLDWAESRARQGESRAPAGSRLLIQTSLFNDNHHGWAFFDKNGYAPVREFVHLEITFKEPPARPTLPEGVVIRPLDSSDWPKVGPALGEAFADHWGVPKYELDEQEEENEAPRDDKNIFDPDYFNSPGLCFVAWSGEQEVAGSCLCNAKIVSKKDCGYLGSLSVPRRWRRQGIGLALTLQAFSEFYRRGIGQVRTDTDADSFTGAKRLYEKAGMTVYSSEIVYEKEIRPGHEWLKRDLVALSSTV